MVVDLPRPTLAVFVRFFQCRVFLSLVSQNEAEEHGSQFFGFAHKAKNLNPVHISLNAAERTMPHKSAKGHPLRRFALFGLGFCP